MDVCAEACEIDLYAIDQLHVIDAVRRGANPLFALADTSKVGLSGHSYGADASLYNAKKDRPEVAAIWSMHPCDGVEFPGILGPIKTNVPVALSTGTLDTVCIPFGVADFYNRLEARHQPPTQPTMASFLRLVSSKSTF